MTALEVVPGGRSKETILVTLAGTDRAPGRGDRAQGPAGRLAPDAGGRRVRRARGRARASAASRCPQPYLRRQEPDGELGDGHLPRDGAGRRAQGGRVLPRPRRSPTEHRRARRQLAAALGPSARAAARRTWRRRASTSAPRSPRRSVTAAVEGMSARIGELSGPPIAAVPLARQWLLDHVADVVPSGRLVLLQGDVGLHNMLVDGDRVTALVDWEAATIGPPARELAAAWPAATALIDWRRVRRRVRRRRRSAAEATDAAGRRLLPGLLRARRLHGEPHRRPPLPHRSQARPPHRPLGSRLALPRPAQPGPRPGGRLAESRRTARPASGLPDTTPRGCVPGSSAPMYVRQCCDTFDGRTR